MNETLQLVLGVLVVETEFVRGQIGKYVAQANDVVVVDVYDTVALDVTAVVPSLVVVIVIIIIIVVVVVVVVDTVACKFLSLQL